MHKNMIGSIMLGNMEYVKKHNRMREVIQRIAKTMQIRAYILLSMGVVSFSTLSFRWVQTVVPHVV